jgi:hypothetical protein
MLLFSRTRANPIFYRDRLEALLGDEPERLERMRTEPGNVDLLTWNVFASLDTHQDQRWLAYRLQLLGGANLRAPVRISLFSGAQRMPYLRPSSAYLRDIHRRTGVDHSTSDGVAIYERPIEVPVRIETPDVLLLVDTALDRLRSGAGGRDRLVELTDAGLEHARRLASSLSLGVVANAGSSVLTSRLPQLADEHELRRALPWRASVPPVSFHGVSWAALLQTWREEHDYLDLDGQPVRDFRAYTERVAA